jgi:hypothetical protein
MNRKMLIIGGLVFAVLAAVAGWQLASAPSKWRGAEIPVTLLGFTNQVTGILVASYATTNMAHRDFAVFSIHNPTRRDFFCYLGPIFFRDQSIQLCHAQSGAFDLPPGATVTFAVPAPDTREAWRCGVVLCHRRTYSPWMFALVRFAQRCGFDRSEKPWFAASSEIVR